MNKSSEAFVKGGLVGWALLFLLETVLFQVNGTLPLSVVPTILILVVGGCLGLICLNFSQLNENESLERETATELLNAGKSRQNSYEEWKKF